MIRYFFPFLCFLLVTSSVFAQLSAPKPEAVYGGRVRGMAAISSHPDSTRIFISTESANTMFVADVFNSPSGTPVFGPFKVIPALSGAAGTGSGVEKIAAHDLSRSVFYLHHGNLMQSYANATANKTIANPGVTALLIEKNFLCYLQGSDLHFGQIDATGNFSPDANSPVLSPISGPISLHVHPLNDRLYLYAEGTTPQLFFLDEPFHAISGTIAFQDVSPTTLSPTMPWQQFGIAPNGKLFIGGSDVMNKQIASANGPMDPWTSYNTGIMGAAGSNLAFAGDSSHFFLYFGSVFNDSIGEPGHWYPFGYPGGFETHANDGFVLVDPGNPSMVYMTTDQGIGASTDNGKTIFEINEGVEAVQVKDFDMTTDKQTAWLASKSGIRKVSNYLSRPSWTPAIFPHGDGSPYYAVAMAKGDTNTVYVGNTRVYKSANGGATWHNLFSATNPPYHFPAFKTPTQGACWVSSLEVCRLDTNIIMAGYAIDDAEEGGLFWSDNGGKDWDQILIQASVAGKDVDVMDIVFTLEGADTVAYIGVAYDLGSPAGRSVYRLTKSGKNWIVSQDMDATGTASGSLIVATIRDLSFNSTGDTLFASGTDAGTNHPLAYYKPINTTGLWTTFPTAGFPFVPGKEAKSITLGVDTIYVAVDNEVFFHEIGSSRWQLGYAYPEGTEINFLFFDELLVGTGTGLYGHLGLGQSTTGIHLDPALAPLSIRPNPSTTWVNVTFENPTLARHLITVQSLDGRELHREWVASAEISLEVRNWPQGIYFIQVAGNQTIFRGTMLVK